MGPTDTDLAVGEFDRLGLTIDHLGRLPLADVRGQLAALDDMEVDERDEFILVLRLEQVLELRCRQLVERGVRWREDRERPRTAELGAEVGLLDRLAEGDVLAVQSGGIEQVLRRGNTRSVIDMIHDW